MQVIARQAQLRQVIEIRQHLVGEVLRVAHVYEVESLDRVAKMTLHEIANDVIDPEEISIHA